MRPGANAEINLWATVPCSRLRTRFNEARREAPGSCESAVDHLMPHKTGSVASMRPGAEAPGSPRRSNGRI